MEQSISETLDRLMPGNLQLIQAKKGHRYSLDAVLLAHFARVKKGKTVVDLGTGVGVVPLLLGRLSDAEKLYGIERQKTLADRARRNVELNAMSDRIEIVEGDIRSIRELLPQRVAGLVVSNPPYRNPGSGRIAPDDERAAARHELAGGLDAFVTAAVWLLESGGRLAMIYLAERLTLLLSTMSQGGIEPKRLRMIHSYADETARMVLVEGARGARSGLIVEPPLVVYRERGAQRLYSQEVEWMYRGGELDDQ